MSERLFLRPIANPLALGFAGLAGATLVAAGLELGWIAQGDRTQAGLIILLFAPLLQLVASLFALLARDAVAATGMGVLSGTWLSIGVVTAVTPAGSTSDALGTFLLLAAAVLVLSGARGMASKPLPAAVMLTAGIRFAVTAIYQLSAGAFWKHAAGVVGLALCGLAVVAVAAIERRELGIGLEREPGVRQSL